MNYKYLKLWWKSFHFEQLYRYCTEKFSFYWPHCR